MGARDFDKYVLQSSDPAVRTRRTDVIKGSRRPARTAEKVAGRVEVEPGEYFLRTRKAVRAALAEEGIGGRMEELVTDVLRDSG